MIKIPPQDKTQLVPLTVKIRPELKQKFDQFCTTIDSDPGYVLTQILTKALKGFTTEGRDNGQSKRQQAKEAAA